MVAKKTVSAKSSAATKVSEVAEIDQTTDEKKPATELVVVPQGALQLDRGHEILSDLFADVTANDQIKELTLSRQSMKRDAFSKATVGVQQLMANDPDFDGSDAYKSEATWRKAVAKIYVSFGIKSPDGKYTAAALQFFPDPNASDNEKLTVDFKRRKSLRDNFGTLCKKATRAAEAARLKGMSLSHNAELHTLRIENAPSSIAGKGQKTVDLTGGEKLKGASDRPTFEALMAIADKTHDPENYARKQTANKGGVANIDTLAHDAATSLKDLTALCNGIIVALTGMNGQVMDPQRKVLQNLYDKLSAFLADAKDI